MESGGNFEDSITFLSCHLLGPVNHGQTWKGWERSGEKGLIISDNQAQTWLIITINDTSIGDLPLIITISDTCKNQPKRLDFDNTINLSSLIVILAINPFLSLYSQNSFIHFWPWYVRDRNISIFRNVEISYLPGRGPGVVGEEGIYGSGGVGTSGARGVCACRPHHGRSNDMRLEEFGLHLRELEVIEIGASWGVLPKYSEFSLYAASP